MNGRCSGAFRAAGASGTLGPVPAFRLLLLLFGLLVGWGAGHLLAANTGDDGTAWVNTLSLMLAGALAALLLGPRAERSATRLWDRLSRWYGGLSPRRVAAATFGLMVALLLSVLLGPLVRSLPLYAWPLSLLVTGVLAAFFVPFALRHAEAFGFLDVAPVRRRTGGKILDSNVIIDGRVLDLARSGFLEGEVIVPGFVLRELQLLADSQDAQKRTRGKRALTLLEDLRAVRPLRVEDWDDPALPTVDDKLVRLARETGAGLLSNDTNLARVARLHGVEVLSLHALALALRPQVQAGDVLTITVTKGGQQPGQGVGYLEDGTMVVVEGGIKLRGRPARVQVVNNVQTGAGRMIFARPEDAGAA